MATTNLIRMLRIIRGAIGVAGLLAIGCRVPNVDTSNVASQSFSIEQQSPADLSAPRCLAPAAGQGGSSDVDVATSDASTQDSSSKRSESAIELASLEGTTEAAEHDRPILTTAGLSLDDAIALSLERNPTLVALRASEPVAHAAYHVAETYPFNPQVQTQVLPYSRDRDGNDAVVAQQYAIVQTFELAGQPGYRAKAAAAEWQQVQATIRQAEIANVAQTERLYFAALYQRDMRDLNQSLADLNAQMVGVVQRRLEAGEASSADVALANLQAESARHQQRLAESKYRTTLAALRNHLKLDASAVPTLSSDWSQWQWRPIDLASLLSLVADRPDILAADAAAWSTRMKLDLANAARTPDLQIGPMYQRDEASTEFWGVQAQMDLPVVNTGRPLVCQREAELQQQRIAASQLREKAVLEAEAAVNRYNRARQIVEQSRAEASGNVDEVLRPVEDQFKAGQISLLEVFAARTSLAQSRQSLLDLLNELGQAAADVTETTGLAPRDLLGDEANSDRMIVPAPEAPEEIPTP